MQEPALKADGGRQQCSGRFSIIECIQASLALTTLTVTDCHLTGSVQINIRRGWDMNNGNAAVIFATVITKCAYESGSLHSPSLTRSMDIEKLKLRSTSISNSQRQSESGLGCK